MFLLLTFAFFAGTLTILSPCILSIAPILLAAGINHNYNKPLGIITGLIISFSFFTLSLTALIQATAISPDLFRYAALIVIIFFGLTMIIPPIENMFLRLTSIITALGNLIQKKSTFTHTKFVGGFILGIALGLVWTPCAGPILGTITALAATHGITFTTILITLSYSIGAALPMLLLCFGGTKIMQSTIIIAPYTETIRRIFGIVIIASALAMFFHIDILLQEKIAHWFPTITFEQSHILKKELDMLSPSQQSLNNKELIQAPEFVGITEWLNSSPLTLAQLKGKVVLLDFWTYTCINCIRTFPHIKAWYNEYKDHGFEVIAIHTPEFAFEKDSSHIKNATQRFNLPYPIALDNDYQTWRAYNNHYWPAHYLIDQEGMIVKTQFGEGGYVEMEDAIRKLLGMQPCGKEELCPSDKQITPEIYLGYERGTHYHPSLSLQKNQTALYEGIETIGHDSVALKGLWYINSDSIHSMSNDGTITLNFIGNTVHLVMKSDAQQHVQILLDGKPLPQKYYTKDMNEKGEIIVHEPRMYDVIDLKDHGRHVLTLVCQQGLHAYAFTFG